MRTLNTERFGTLHFEDERVIDFPLGLPGFEGESAFLLVETEAMRPIVFLQSIATPSLSFAMVPVSLVDSGYRLRMTSQDRQVLGLESDAEAVIGSEVLCFGILCANDGTAPTVNLLGPIVVDQKRRLGVQAVREDTLYSAQHELFPAEQGDAKCL
jgi:flagellar assembly factor FliW